MPPYESGRRLCLLMDAGETRFSVEATSIMEVAAPGPDETSLRGVLEVKDLSVLLGGEPERVPGMIVVFDVSPTLAVRVRSIVEAADVATDPHFLLPAGLGATLAAISHSAVLHKDRLYLELIAEALPHTAGLAIPPPKHPVQLIGSMPDRSLVFESQGRLFGIALPLISQVVMQGSAFSPLPGRGGAVAGVIPHGRTLWPIYSAPALLGAPATPEAFLVLAEVAGKSLGLCASRVLGVHPRFMPAEEPGEFRIPGMQTPVLFLDLPRMFS